MRIVHFSDLHLDSPFAWAGASGDVARRRRDALRETLRRIVSLTRELGADALFSGGDLYEHDRVTPDTAEFLRLTFAGLAPIRVFLAPGNHDWFGPLSVYARVDWSANVHVFTEASLRPVPLGDGVSLWGAAHRAPANTDNFLDGFRVEGDGVHLALFHGAERSWFSEQGGGKQPHAPFDAPQIEQAGLHHAFLGHYHRPKDASHHTYPGNPDPLQFGEDGERGVVVATIDAGGRVARERHRVAVTAVHDLDVDVSGCSSRQQVVQRLEALTAGLSGLARVTLRGDVEPSLDLREGDLRDAMSGFDAVQIHVGALRPAYDIPALSEERTVRGQFVRDVLAARLDEHEQRRVLVTGLRALAGRADLEVL